MWLLVLVLSCCFCCEGNTEVQEPNTPSLIEETGFGPVCLRLQIILYIRSRETDSWNDTESYLCQEDEAERAVR